LGQKDLHALGEIPNASILEGGKRNSLRRATGRWEIYTTSGKGKIVGGCQQKVTSREGVRDYPVM